MAHQICKFICPYLLQNQKLPEVRALWLHYKYRATPWKMNFFIDGNLWTLKTNFSFPFVSSYKNSMPKCMHHLFLFFTPWPYSCFCCLNYRSVVHIVDLLSFYCCELFILLSLLKWCTVIEIYSCTLFLKHCGGATLSGLKTLSKKMVRRRPNNKVMYFYALLFSLSDLSLGTILTRVSGSFPLCDC